MATEDPALAAQRELAVWDLTRRQRHHPELGPSLSRSDFARLARMARGTFRQRVYAAGVLALVGGGLADRSEAEQAALVTIVESFAAHPAMALRIPAALALGRLATRRHDLRASLAARIRGERVGASRLAVMAVAAAPSHAAWASPLVLEALADQRDAWLLAALGNVLPAVITERPELWDAIAAALAVCPAESRWRVARSTAEGLAAARDVASDDPAAATRLAKVAALVDGVAYTANEPWLPEETRWALDAARGLDPDPWDIARSLERAATLASVAPRAAASRAQALLQQIAPLCEAALAPALATARDVAADVGVAAAQARALAVAGSLTRAFAQALWAPVVCAAGGDPDALDGVREAAREALERAALRMLRDPDASRVVQHAGLVLLGDLLDAADDTAGDAARRGRVATVALRALRDAPQARPGQAPVRGLRKYTGDVLWRVLDAAHGQDAPAAAAPRLLSRLSAWWALSTAQRRVSTQLRRAYPGLVAEAGTLLDAGVARLRVAVLPAREAALAPGWFVAVADALARLDASRTRLASALRGLATAAVAPPGRSLDASLRVLAEAVAALAGALADAEAALADDPRLPRGSDAPTARTVVAPDPHLAPAAPPVASAAPVARGSPWTDDLVERTLAAAAEADVEPARVAAVWDSGLGPYLGPLVVNTVAQWITAHRAAHPETVVAQAPVRVGGFVLRHRLGEGGMGRVWLATRAGAEDRRIPGAFALKLPRPPRHGAQPREVIERAIQVEAEALRRLHHHNIVRYVEHGWHDGRPYVVTERLVGTDLGTYARARRLTVRELKPVVRDVAGGLAALHGAKIVHRDLKPGNVFLCLDLPHGRAFDPSLHRDPEACRMQRAVLIDFGVVNDLDAPEVSRAVGRFRSEGFLSPEQATGTADVTAAADVYALAATVYAAMTGRMFFDDVDRHVRALMPAARPPLEDAARVRGMAPALVRLLREATALRPEERPGLADFARRFERLG